MERGHTSFGVFAILVGALFFFMVSGLPHESGYAISGNNSELDNHNSFCLKYSDEDREEDNHEYSGYCTVYYDDIVSVSGVVVGVEYWGQDSIKYNTNSINHKAVRQGEEVSYKFEDGESFSLIVSEILYSSKSEDSSSTTFDYTLSYEKPQSFCEGIYCTIHLGDELKIQEHELDFEEFCTDPEDCDLIIEVDGKDYEVNTLKEGSTRKLDNLTLFFEEFNIDDGYMRFKHNYRMNGTFCNDTDRGQDYFNKGMISGFFENENYTYGEKEVVPFSFSDYCFELTETLIEFSCDSNEYLTVESHLCLGECMDGLCIGIKENEGQGNLSLENLSDSKIIPGKIEDEIVYEEPINNSRDESKKDLYVQNKESRSLFEKVFSWFGKLF